MASRKHCESHKRYSARCENCRTMNFATEVGADAIIEAVEKMEPVAAPEEKKVARVVFSEVTKRPKVTRVEKLGFVPCRRDIECAVCR